MRNNSIRKLYKKKKKKVIKFTGNGKRTNKTPDKLEKVGKK